MTPYRPENLLRMETATYLGRPAIAWPRSGVRIKRRGTMFFSGSRFARPAPTNKKGHTLRCGPSQNVRGRNLVLRVEFHDQVRLHHHRIGHIAQRRCAHESRCHL